MGKFPETVSSNRNDAFVIDIATLLVISTFPVTSTSFGNQPASEVRSVFSMTMSVATSASSSSSSCFLTPVASSGVLTTMPSSGPGPGSG